MQNPNYKTEKVEFRNLNRKYLVMEKSIVMLTMKLQMSCETVASSCERIDIYLIC